MPEEPTVELYPEDEFQELEAEEVSRSFLCIRGAYVCLGLFANGVAFLPKTVPTMTSAVEPAVGDKRPREDDSMDYIPNLPPASRASSQNASGQGYNTIINNSATTATNGQSGSMVLDALYIGDLQWVRTVLSFSVMCIPSSTCSFFFANSFPLYSLHTLLSPLFLW
jgi:hypothetical protein